MKINDVEKITGLTQKAIRLYESKGLINVTREENGYRNYSEKDVEALKKIKLYRSIGISVSDIRLCLFGVLDLDELIEKRKNEILKESGKNSENYKICQSILEKSLEEETENIKGFIEGEEAISKEHGALSVGIDIGTTTVCAVVYDVDNCEQLETYSVPHNSYVCSGVRSEQCVSVIMDKAEKLLYHVLDTYKGVISIGISGQMHGIVYVNTNGEAVSNLINWQDKRADLILDDRQSTCQKIFNITGESISTGYGVATHYYNLINGEVPREAVAVCSIMDLFAMRICGGKTPVTHVSVGASFGMFDTKNGCYMAEKLQLLGIKETFFSRVIKESEIIGKCRDIPVSVPLGDNQASFLGSVSNNESSILINVGTGSQISAVSDYKEVSGDIEIRPFIEGKYLLCGSALCGGFAYSMLEEFFRSYLISCGMPDTPQYKTINRLALEAYEGKENGLSVDTSFCGKRSDPSVRGSVSDIDRQNFTPSNLVLGVLKGMCKELYNLYNAFPQKKKCAVASGGAVRQNDVLKLLLSECFDMPVTVNSVKEEAATGAALFSAFCIGRIEYKNGFFKGDSHAEY